MGREVRKVPSDWEHPKKFGRYIPLFDYRMYVQEMNDWYSEAEKNGIQHTIDNIGDQPNLKHYMPNFGESATHYMMYENTSEGTPLSPSFETPEELAQWLFDNEVGSFANYTATYDEWLSVCKGAKNSVGLLVVTKFGTVV